MSSTRDFKNPGIFADAATTVIPPTPIAGVAYRDAVAGADDTPNGWRYGTRVASQDWNQVMYLLTSMMGMMDIKGLLGYSDDVDYTEAALVFGSDGTVYSWLLENGPGTGAGVQDPVSAPTYWRATNLGDPDIYQQSGPPVYVTSTQTVNFPAGVRAMLVEAVGGGGAGGGCTADAAHTTGGAGGGAGNYARKFLTAGFGASQLCTIGAGGAGVNAANGNAGGTTSFGALVTAGGGAGGAASTASATMDIVAGGTGSAVSTGAEFVSTGGHGENGWCLGSSASARGQSGSGGDSYFGAGEKGRVIIASDSFSGSGATSRGAGGAGAGLGSAAGGGSQRSGGAGAAGMIKITYYK